MALAFYFAHDGFTPEKYTQAISKLEAAGGVLRRVVHSTLPSSQRVRFRSSTSGSHRRISMRLVRCSCRSSTNWGLG